MDYRRQHPWQGQPLRDLSAAGNGTAFAGRHGGIVKGRILIVDDEQSMCEALEAGLTPKGFETRWTTSATAALEQLEGAEVDVVLTDLNMRGMNGLELCERVVANRPDVPVVVITAFGSFETAVAAIRAGAYDFVTKPVKTDALAL